MNLYLKYQSPNTFSSKDIVQLKVYQNSDKIQSHKFRSLGTKKLGQSSKSRSQVLVPKERSLHHAFISQLSKS